MAYAELHFHLLPGIDDGPASMRDSLDLAAAAAHQGTRTIVATPHVSPQHVRDVSVLPELVADVQARLDQEQIPIEVVCGAELSHHMVGQLTDQDYEVIANGPPEGRWLLLEASLAGLDESFNAAADKLRAGGYEILVAHPERALLGRRAGWQALEHELAAGSAMQVNAWSLAGLYGGRVRRDAFRVLQVAPVAAVASDAHGRARMPALDMALDALSLAGDPEKARRMAAIPQMLLRDGLPVGAAPVA